MDDVYPGSDGFDERKGWDRASVAYRSRKPYRPDISQKDLLLPNEAGKARTILICAACAICITLLYVGFPLYMVSLFVPMGVWFVGSLAAICVALAVLLSWYSFHETREFRELANER
jgi:hypothetical protein